MNDQDFIRLKQIELDTLIVVKNICLKHEIPYFLVCGTLLGAVRHKGFIPWDDDIDIAMFRKDYECFQKIAIDELGDKYFLQTDKTDYWNAPFSKVRCNGTLFEDADTPQNAKCHRGVFIDIFPLDNVKSPNSLSFKIRAKIVRLLNILLYRKFGQGRLTAAGLNYRIGVIIATLIPRMLMLKLRHYLMVSDNNSETEYITSFGSGYGAIKQLFPRSAYFPSTELEFEHEEFSVPGKYKTILEQIFGDYMKLPPENKRVYTHPVKNYEF
jgi:lipopolysaccharide cholinephosphotransferase